MRKRILNYSILNSSFNYINIIEGVSKVTAVRPEGAEAHSPGPLGSAACLSKNTLGKKPPKTMRPVRAKALIINAFALAGRLLFSIRTPKVLPWAMCFWGFQPVLLTFDTPSSFCLLATMQFPFTCCGDQRPPLL